MKEAVAAIVVNTEGKILIGKKMSGTEGVLAGKWHLPGETQNPGESDEECLIRGIKEETGVDIIVLRYLDTHHTSTPTKVKWYECRAVNETLVPGSDLEAAEWVEKFKVPLICAPESVAMWPEAISAYFAS